MAASAWGSCGALRKTVKVLSRDFDAAQKYPEVQGHIQQAMPISRRQAMTEMNENLLYPEATKTTIARHAHDKIPRQSM